jgi:hypothetical protein
MLVFFAPDIGFLPSQPRRCMGADTVIGTKNLAHKSWQLFEKRFLNEYDR